MSAFSTEEVEFVRSRGNLWAQKVWLGLYDISRLGLYDAKDDEGIRSFIIDKYEKKRWVVIIIPSQPSGLWMWMMQDNLSKPLTVQQYPFCTGTMWIPQLFATR